ncbi:MAG: betaine-aldehyde dehydrogenase [Candidatus Tectimicrobiota bacterium]|nr:MAG: betaine-aldehyde dehydrogenase [Candidatus Tectomicrobia bacterium]
MAHEIRIPIAVPLFIAGEEGKSAAGRRFQRENPTTPEQVVSISEAASPEEVAAAVAAAREAFDRDVQGWVSNYKLREQVLYRTAALLREHAPALETLLGLEVGMPRRQARPHVLAAAEVFEFYAGYASKLYGHALVLPNGSLITLLKEPVGVVGAITPWNFPLTQAARKLAPALAVGCTLVVKPASYTPAVTYHLLRLLHQAGAPPGVVNFVPGPGPVVGKALVEDPRVDKISFTGETETGREILAGAARTLKRVSLELGGKNPFLLFADAPLEAAARSLVFGAFRNSGQACGATSRLLVAEAVHDAFLEVMLPLVRALRLGPPLDEATDLGPLISRAQQEKVLAYIALGTEGGFRLLAGGRAPQEAPLRQGYFVEPTVFDGVDHASRLAQEEIFGPVLTIHPFREEEEAVALANGVTYGLTASVWTADMARAQRVARRLKAGTVWINDAYTQPPEGIWGGYKQSGIGRELGPYGIEDFVEVKQVYTDGTGLVQKPHYRQLLAE